MPQNITVKAYVFDELSDEAKENAREWWRDGGLDYPWWDDAIYDAVEIGKILGIEISNRRGSEHEPAIYFSVFYSQGDGACFEGYYHYADMAHKKIRAYAPQDTCLHEIADNLLALQKRVWYSANASIRQEGRYYHAYSMNINVDMHEDISSQIFNEVEEGIIECMRNFANWIYYRLQKEYEWLNSDEQVDDAIMCNEYLFTKDGSRHVTL